MISLTEEQFASSYLIYKNLSGERPHKTFLAMTGGGENPFPVILKETDEKRAAIYQELCGMYNPYLADTYGVLCVSGETAGKNPDAVDAGPAPGAAKDESAGRPTYYAVTEYVCAEGSPDEECLSLTQFVRRHGPLSEKSALQIGLQLCLGLKDFHKKGFVHRDLKPDNIMIAKYDSEQPKIKIVDFGGAKWNRTSRRGDTTVVGTLGYQAPESLAAHTTRRADIYSIGCILNFLLTGKDPGLAQYRKNHYITCLIEKASNEDPSHRHESVAELQKDLEHLLGKRLIDRIPFIRALPGFRTDTMWKTVLAGAFYSLLLLIAAYCRKNYTLAISLAEIFLPYIVIPLIVIFNMGNLLRFFPEGLRRNNRLFFKIKAGILIVAFWEPIWIDYLIAHM